MPQGKGTYGSKKGRPPKKKGKKKYKKVASYDGRKELARKSRRKGKKSKKKNG